MDLPAIQNKIYEIRGYKVMLDFDLAEMYQVETKVLNQAVKRNIERFPFDFMFQLTNKELADLRSQFVTSSWGGTRYLPYAFSEHGVTMLSSVLKSKKAIDTNISIVRAFVALRQYALGYAELKQQLDNFMLETNLQFNEIYQAFTELAEQKRKADKPRNPIGYQHIERKE
ncbi:MAG: ORF6N domain-containing protein [Dysgonamonadaceae bacterium]|nr:ORF6N domain-containing protein [Dysgonamonadaceae bacterium]